MFTVPDFYPEFKCKISGCRSSCCMGWEITVSMTDYFKLIGLPCKRAMRRRLDGSLYILDHPTSERYAAFVKTFDGDCPMHDPDGFCALQRACGEKALTSVCRYYPRSPRTRYGYECALSISCEGVCEMLFARKEPIKFIKIPLSFDIPLPPPVKNRITPFYARVRELYISVLQRRALSLRDRLLLVCDISETLSKPFLSGTAEEMDAAVKSAESLDISGVSGFSPLRAYDVALRLLDCFESHHSIYEFAEEAKKNLGLTGTPDADALARFETAVVAFRKRFPDWETMLEQILVNHVFYEGFPFSSEKESIGASCASLCAFIALQTVIAVGYTMTHQAESDLADMTASAFRLIENSDFDLCAASMLVKENFIGCAELKSLVSLI